MNYDKWKLDTPDNHLHKQKHTDCEYCMNDITEGDECFKSDIGIFCDGDCFLEYCKSYHNGRYRTYE